jgi:ammonium transporter Rh
LATFSLSALLGKHFIIEDILNATLAGGVAIGAPCGMIYSPGIAMAIGFISGLISTLGYHYLTPKL